MTIYINPMTIHFWCFQLWSMNLKNSNLTSLYANLVQVQVSYQPILITGLKISIKLLLFTSASTLTLTLLFSVKSITIDTTSTLIRSTHHSSIVLDSNRIASNQNRKSYSSTRLMYPLNRNNSTTNKNI